VSYLRTDLPDSGRPIEAPNGGSRGQGASHGFGVNHAPPTAQQPAGCPCPRPWDFTDSRAGVRTSVLPRPLRGPSEGEEQHLGNPRSRGASSPSKCFLKGKLCRALGPRTRRPLQIRRLYHAPAPNAFLRLGLRSRGIGFSRGGMRGFGLRLGTRFHGTTRCPRPHTQRSPSPGSVMIQSHEPETQEHR
jgi:hypothetical protein